MPLSQWAPQNVEVVGLPKPKRSFFKKNGDRDNSVSGQAKVFSRKLGTDNNRSDNTNIVKGWKLPVIGRPHQWREPNQIPMSERERVVVKEEIHSMIQKGALTEVQSVKGQFILTIFVRPK